MIRVTHDELNQWFDLAERLDDLTSFNFYGVTLRKEKRRHGYYWYAYKRIGGKLFNQYCGDKWRLRECLPHLVQQLTDRANGVVVSELLPSSSSAKPDWFEAWILGETAKGKL